MAALENPKIVDAIDMEPRHLAMVRSVLARNVPFKEVWAYGSRVNWNATERSDLDCVVFGASDSEIAKTREAFEYSDIPFEVQVFAWDSLPKDFQENIRKRYFVLRTKEDWGEFRLGDVTKKIGSGATPTGGSNAYLGGNIALIRSQNVLDFSFSPDGLVYISDEQASKLNNVTVEEHDVLLNITGDSVARSCIVDKKYLPARVNQHVAIIRVDKQEADYHYVFYDLQQKKEELLSHSEVGATRRALTKGIIENLWLNLPQLPEQRAIAGVLSSLDDKIDLLHCQNKTLKSLAEALFRQWFIIEASEEWETVRVGDVAKTNISTIKTNYSHQTIRYLDTGSITEGKIESLQPYSLSDAPSRAKRLVQHNDIIISTVRPNHKHYGFIKNPAEDLVVSTGFCVLTCTGIDPHFMYLFLTSEDMTEYLSVVAEASTSTYPSLKPSDIEAIEFQKPPTDLLKKLSEIVSDSWKKIESNYNQIHTLETLRNALLPKLMSGEVRVQYDPSQHEEAA